jgi:hypothetical protein
MCIRDSPKTPFFIKLDDNFLSILINNNGFQDSL